MLSRISQWDIGYAAIPATIVTCFLYYIIRPFWKVKVNCWFCNENIYVGYHNRKVFVCSKCGQYNGFTEDGDYDRFIPEQKYEHLNPVLGRKGNGMRRSKSENLEKAANGLCQNCNMGQAVIQAQINKFEPQNEDNFDVEFQKYKAFLKKKYPLCKDCKKFVDRKLRLDEQIYGFLGSVINRTYSVCSSSIRSYRSSQKCIVQSSGSSQHSRNHQRRRRRAALFNCGPISNFLNLITFATSCCLFAVYFMQLQHETDTYLLDLSQYLPSDMLATWIPFLIRHTSKMTFFGLGLHILSVAVMRARRSLPDIVAFFIWCALSLLDLNESEKHEMHFSQLSFSSVLCIVSFAVAFLPRKLLHRKRPNNIIHSAFSIASTPVSQCSTLSIRTSPGRGVSFSGSLPNMSASSRETTPSRELGKMLNTLSLGDDSSAPERTAASLKRRRGPFDSMKKPILAEPRLRLGDTRGTPLLDIGARSRYIRSLAPSSVTSVSTVNNQNKFTLFNIICILGALLSVAMNAAIFYKLFYSTSS